MAFTIVKNTNLDFVGKRRIAYIVSLAVILVGIVFMFARGGLRYGVDFAGGVIIQAQFAQPVEDEVVKSVLTGIDMPGLTVQESGPDRTEYILRFSASEEGSTDFLREAVEQAFVTQLPGNTMTITRLEMVGPKVGAELRSLAVEAIFYAILLITVYISGRFENTWAIAAGVAAIMWIIVYLAGLTPAGRMVGVAVAMLITILVTWKLKLNYALGTIVSLLHDLFATLGLLMLFNIEIDLNIIAALLTLIGYSLNDTIIVFDRIRENLRNLSPKLTAHELPSMGKVINDSLNQTLSRTILTSGTTLVAGLSLYLLGGSVIHNFAFTIIIGVIIGTYSSIFVASPILMAFGDTDMYRKVQTKEKVYEKPGEHGIV